MIRFDQVQSTLAGLIATYVAAPERPELDGLLVLEDLGTEANEQDIEAALQEEFGAAVSITVPVQGKTLDQKGTAVVLDTSIFVLVSFNPNVVGAISADRPGLYDLVKHVFSAVLNPAQKPVNPNDRFGVAENAIQLDVLDAGLFRYQLTFTKRCVL